MNLSGFLTSPVNDSLWDCLFAAVHAPATPGEGLTIDIEKVKSLISDLLVGSSENSFVLSHGKKVAHVASRIGAVLGLDDLDLFRLKMGGLLHDVGKCMVPVVILQKPGTLSAVERTVLRQHVFSGALLASCLNEPIITQIVFYHHERYDGSGYLSGLKGKDIPYLPRIVSVADAFAARTVTRCYHKALSISQAAQIIEKGAGTHFDPEIVSAFLSVVESFNKEEWPSDHKPLTHIDIPLVPGGEKINISIDHSSEAQRYPNVYN